MSKKSEEVEKPAAEKHDRLEGAPKEPESPPFYPIGNPPPEREVKPEPWDNQDFYDKVRAAGFPTSSCGDAAFMQACYNLAVATQPPAEPAPPPPPDRKHADKTH